MVSLYRVDYSNTSQVVVLLNEFKRFGLFLGIQSLAIKGILTAMDQAITDDTTPIVALVDEANLGRQIIWLYFNQHS